MKVLSIGGRQINKKPHKKQPISNLMLYFVTVIDYSFSQSTISIQDMPLRLTSMLNVCSCGTNCLLKLERKPDCSPKKKRRPSSYTYWSNLRLSCQVLFCVLIRLFVINLTDNQEDLPADLLTKSSRIKTLTEVLHAIDTYFPHKAFIKN